MPRPETRDAALARAPVDNPIPRHPRRFQPPLRRPPPKSRTVALATPLLCGLLLAAFIGPFENRAQAASPNVSLAGVHWYSGDSGMLDSTVPLGERGWNIEVIFDVGWCDGNPATDPGGVRAVAQTAKDHGLLNIIRVDYRQMVAVPANSGEFDGWAASFIRCTQELSDLSSRYIVGNEPNIEGNLSAAQYATAFNHLYGRRGEMPAGTELLATFNSPFTPPGWMGEMATALNGVEGFAIHTGGIRANCLDPRQSCSFGGWNFDGAFRYYRDVINNIPSKWWGKPVYITEFNTYTGDPGSEPQNNYLADWINKAFEEIRSYNAGRGSKPAVRALAWFVDRPQSWPSFSLRNIGAARTDMGEEFKNPANRGGVSATSTPSVPTSTPRPATATPVPPAGSLQNGGFEGAVQPNGVGQSWSPFSSSSYGPAFSVVSDVVHAGSRAQKLAANPSANDQYAGFFQTISTSPGTAYTVRAWSRVNLPGGSGWPIVARLGIDLSGGTNYAAPSVTWVEFDAPENGLGGWVSRERSVTASGSSMTLFLQSWRKWAGSSSETWFDDVEVQLQGGPQPTATPRPATPTPPPPGLPPGQNIARGKAWQASSVYGPAWGGDKATDGLVSVSSKWTSNGATAESWLALDLGQAYSLSGFVVRHAGAAGEAAYFNTQAFRLESGSSFSGPWATLASVSNPTQTQNLSTVVLAAPASARFVRLTITDAGIDNYARIPEFEVYSTGASTPAPTSTQPAPTATPRPATPTPSAPTPTPSGPAPTTPPNCPPALDFASIRRQLNQQGQDLAFVKIGFHAGPGGNHKGLGEWEQCLDAAGVPFFLKSVDDAGKILEAARLKAASGVPHTLVYRKAGLAPDGYWYDVPNYSLTPEAAALEHWQRHMAVFPPELLPYKDLIWLETVNEVDKGRAEWLAEFAYHTAQLALRDGFNWAAFGWSSGEPEPEHWRGPGPNSWMRRFLELAGANPVRIAIALHEYSFDGDSLEHGLFAYPSLVGRYLWLYEATDELGFGRPTVLITEFGWEATNVPGVEVAFDRDGDPEIDNLPWAAEVYAQDPSVKGAAIWYLGQGYGGIANQAQQLIRPLLEYALQHYFVSPLAGSTPTPTPAASGWVVYDTQFSPPNVSHLFGAPAEVTDADMSTAYYSVMDTSGIRTATIYLRVTLRPATALKPTCSGLVAAAR